MQHIKRIKDSSISVSDQFCGAGGSSWGAYLLGLQVLWAWNHWKRAIETHNTNFPHTQHDCVDISTVNPRRYSSTNILITSPECTAHTYADGKKKPSKQMELFPDGQTYDPAAERSRATMWNVVDFAEVHHYDIIVVENVVNAADWILFDSWLRAMWALGYAHHIVYFNSMFAHLRPLSEPKHGLFAPQSRDRMYCVFWKKGNKKPDLEFRPLAWCPCCERDVEAAQTWRPTKAVKAHGGRWGRYGKRQQYVYTCPHCSIPRRWVIVHPYFYCAANAIDWSIPITRIGDRDEALEPTTIRRVEVGLEMFEGQDLVIDMSRTHGHDRRSAPLFRRTLPTQTTTQSAALLMVPPFTVETLFTDGNRRPRPMDEPLGTQTTRQSTAVIIPPFILGYANQESKPRGLDEPLRTFHTENGQAVVMPPFMVEMRGTTSGMNQPKGVDETLGTISAGGRHHALVAPPFLMSYYGSGGGQRLVDREMGTIPTVDRHALVQPGSTIKPEDCGFRVLSPFEIQLGMAFDPDYIVTGNNKEKVRQLGNAVTPPVMKMILERCVETLI